MRANELRIGNLVLDKDGNKFQINGVLENSVFKEGDYIGTPIEWIKPIQLTEEWLLKFGFKNNELIDKHLIFIWFGDHVGIKGMLGLVKPWSCVHVHQLQNLYFALINEELTIKI